MNPTERLEAERKLLLQRRELGVSQKTNPVWPRKRKNNEVINRMASNHRRSPRVVRDTTRLGRGLRQPPIAQHLALAEHPCAPGRSVTPSLYCIVVGRRCANARLRPQLLCWRLSVRMHRSVVVGSGSGGKRCNRILLEPAQWLGL